MTTLPDTRDRHAALHDFAHNLVVVAGAGTGKTSLLVGRLLAALTLQHLEPHEVLALTFTENAAAEMHERLLRLLASFEPWLDGAAIEASDRHVLSALDLGPEFRSRVAELRERSEDLAITTFHGFCLRLLRDNAHTLDLPPDLRLEDETVNRGRFEAAFVDYLGQLTEPHEALRRFEPTRLRELAWALLGLPADCLDRWDRDIRPPDLREPRLGEHRQDLRDLRAAHAGARPAWSDLCGALLGVYDDLLDGRQPRPVEVPRKNRAPAAGVRELGDKTRSERASAALQLHLDRLLPACLANPEGIAVALDLLRPFLADYRRQRLQRAEVTFDDLLLLTRRHLMQDPRFRRRSGGTLKALLVDEFQDTDPLQYDVIFLLAAAAEEPEVDAPLEVSLRPSVLYIVGDPCQSIYRFRRADVAAFARAVERVISQNGRELHLVSNFRSDGRILEFVHRVCARSLAEERPFQFGYQQVVATLEDGADDAVGIHHTGPGDRAVTRRKREGRHVIAAIRELHDRGHRFGDIAILLRAAVETSWLLRPLREAGIPYVLEGSKLFYRRHEISLATALIAALARPGDPVAVLAVLRSSLVGATDAEIARHLTGRGALDFRLAERPTAGGARVHEGLRWLRELHESTRRRPVNEALPEVLVHPRLLVTEGHGFEGAQRIANLDRLLSRLLALDFTDLQAVADWLLRHTEAGTQDEESPLFDEGMDAVRILTVHRAKGLEFDAVLVPDLARQVQSREPEVQAQRLFSAAGDEVVALRLDDSRNLASAIAQIEYQRHQVAEERRLFYVAATRARRRLVLFCDDRNDRRAVWQSDLREADAEQAATLHRREAPAAPRRSRRARVAAAPILRALRAHRDLAAHLGRTATATVVAPSHLDGPAIGPRTGQDREAAQRLGNAVHCYLALVDLRLAEPDQALLEQVAAAGEDPRVLAELRELAAGFHRSALRTRLAAATRLLREVPVAHVEDGRLIAGTIDALVVEGDRITVLDYKSERIDDPRQAARAHRHQLRAYGQGVQKALDLPGSPALEVHFLRTDQTCPVEDG